jgi:hypothetical protein
MYQRAMQQRAAGGRPRRFDEYYRCYPVAMMPGPEREQPNHGGKLFMPASALDKLTLCCLKSSTAQRAKAHTQVSWSSLQKREGATYHSGYAVTISYAGTHR